MRVGTICRSLALSLCVAALSVAAHADALVVFTSGIGDSSISYSFTLDSSTPVSYVSGVSVSYSNVDIVQTNGATFFATVTFTNAETLANKTLHLLGKQGIDFTIAPLLNLPLINYSGTQLYSGNESNAKLIAGNFHLTPTIGLHAPGTLEISLTPEPSSLVLLGTGTLGMLGFARRKLRAADHLRVKPSPTLP